MLNTFETRRAKYRELDTAFKLKILFQLLSIVIFLHRVKIV